ncbi:PepSY domain-containing protein [Bacillus sp. FJAT-29790]|uniref:PepSY domain-containing protein n=1 Tax=Bacillus sp. FJAT-29790 TaxID=1895002 RepID=UPI001C217F08|nr:PepSY domain-containing protein [Bacillus sp. FJAT-29790]MBU8880108.1 PepSY domain-containing protein [Bacillus sp. FJAT-29790]
MKHKFLIGILSACVILGGAVAVGAAKNDTSTSNQLKVKEIEKIISISEAKNIALSKVNGNVESVELKNNLGKQYYEVDIKNGEKNNEIHINAFTGEIMSVTEDIDHDDKNNDRVDFSQSTNTISEQKAIGIVEKAVNGTVIEIDKDDDDGQSVYEFELNTNQGRKEVKINAVTGKIVKIENEDVDDDNDLDD